MASQSPLLDETGWKLVELLQENARLSFAELGRSVNLSAPAVAERIRRLEDAGVIRGYRAEIARESVGMPITVFIRLETPPGIYDKVRQFAAHTAQILELHHVTGTESFLIKAGVCSLEDLESLIGRLSQFGPSVSSLVLSTYFERRIVHHPQRRRKSRP